MKAYLRTSFLVFAVLIVSGVATAVHTPSQKHLKRKDCLAQCQAEINAMCTPHQHFHQCRGTLIRKCQHRKLVCAGATTTTTPGSSTTTTTTAGSSTTTTTTPGPMTGTVKGALASTPGRFNFNAMLGLPGANAACNTSFAGTHACTYAELQTAAAAGGLTGLKDVATMPVTSFWAIDSSADPLQQCNDDVNSHQNWEYATAHTMSRGEKVDLNNAAGTLGTLQTSVQCNISGNAWVACCQ
jgi:hypothetical protein